jgi:transposase-like protein
MLNTKGMRFPIDVILACIRWYAAYPLSYRHLEEMMDLDKKKDTEFL